MDPANEFAKYISSPPAINASTDVFFTRLAACTAKGGMMMRIACGKMITNMVCQYENPWLFAASNWPRWMEPMPERTTSEM